MHFPTSRYWSRKMESNKTTDIFYCASNCYITSIYAATQKLKEKKTYFWFYLDRHWHLSVNEHLETFPSSTPIRLFIFRCFLSLLNLIYRHVGPGRLHGGHRGGKQQGRLHIQVRHQRPFMELWAGILLLQYSRYHHRYVSRSWKTYFFLNDSR